MALPEFVAWQLDNNYRPGIGVVDRNGVPFDGNLSSYIECPNDLRDRPRQVAIGYACGASSQFPEVWEYLECYGNCAANTVYDKTFPAPAFTGNGAGHLNRAEFHWLWVKPAQLMADTMAGRNTLAQVRGRYDAIFLDEAFPINYTAMGIKNCDNTNFGSSQFLDPNGVPYTGVRIDLFKQFCIQPALDNGFAVCVTFADPNGHASAGPDLGVPNHVVGPRQLTDEYKSLCEELVAYSPSVAIAPQLYNPNGVGPLAQYTRESQLGINSALDVNPRTYMWFAIRDDINYPNLTFPFVEDIAQGRWMCTPVGVGFWTYGSSTRATRTGALNGVYRWRRIC